MKTLFGTFKLILLGTIGVAAVLTFRVFAQAPAQKKTPPPETLTGFVLKIKSPEAAVKDEDAFKALLCNGHYDGKVSSIHMIHSPGHPGPLEEDFPPCAASSRLDIKTDKVTTSELAKGLAVREFTRIGSNVTQQVCSQNKADIQAVLDQLR